MIKKIYIQRENPAVRNDEYDLLVRWANNRQYIPNEVFTLKDIHRNSFEITPETLVYGDTLVMASVFKRLGIQMPLDNSYPDSLREWLRRDIRTTTLQAIRVESASSDWVPMFVKPAEKTKAFTGFVVENHEQLMAQTGSLSKHLKVSVATPVKFVGTETRVYVVTGNIMNYGHYYRNDGVAGFPMKDFFGEVRKMIDAFESSGQAPIAYAIDVGVVDGKLTLVEFNDAWSLGAYAPISPEIYGLMISLRWNQLMGKIP